MVKQGQNLARIFKNAVPHYNVILNQLKNDEFYDTVYQKDIQDNIDKNAKIIEGLDSDVAMLTVNQNREFLCYCLHGYSKHLELIKRTMTDRFKNEFALPLMDLSNIEEELISVTKILEESCKDYQLRSLN